MIIYIERKYVKQVLEKVHIIVIEIYKTILFYPWRFLVNPPASAACLTKREKVIADIVEYNYSKVIEVQSGAWLPLQECR